MKEKNQELLNELLNKKLLDFSSNKNVWEGSNFDNTYILELWKMPQLHKLIIEYLDSKLPYNIRVSISNGNIPKQHDYDFQIYVDVKNLPFGKIQHHLNNNGLFKTLQQQLDDFIEQLLNTHKFEDEFYIIDIVNFEFSYKLDSSQIPPNIIYSDWNTKFYLITF